MAVEIIHISDIHLGQRNLNWAQRAIKMHKAQSEAYQALRRAVGGMLARQTPETIAILSGDFTIIGGIEEIGDALDEWNTLTGGQKTWVLGNHDFWNGNVLSTVAHHQTVHCQVRAAYWPPGRVTPLTDGEMRVSIYELDTTPQEGLLGLYNNVIAKGELSKTQIDELREQILANGTWNDGPDLVLAIMHHPLRKGFRDPLRVLAWLRELPWPMVMIMAGHTHLWTYTAPGPIQATCGSSTFESRDDGPPAQTRPPSFLVHRLEQSGHSVVLNRSVWEFDGSEFQRLPAGTLPGPYVLMP